MTEQLLSMLVNEVKQFEPSEYSSLQAIKNRLKRNGRGEWISSLGGFKGERTLTVKRVK